MTAEERATLFDQCLGEERRWGFLERDPFIRLVWLHQLGPQGSGTVTAAARGRPFLDGQVPNKWWTPTGTQVDAMSWTLDLRFSGAPYISTRALFFSFSQCSQSCASRIAAANFLAATEREVWQSSRHWLTAAFSSTPSSSLSALPLPLSPPVGPRHTRI